MKKDMLAMFEFVKEEIGHIDRRIESARSMIDGFRAEIVDDEEKKRRLEYGARRAAEECGFDYDGIDVAARGDGA